MAERSCSHKRLIGRKVLWVPVVAGLPQICVKCGSIFAIEVPRVIKGVSRNELYLCSKCLDSIVCDKCKKPIERDNLYIAECMYCNKVFFFCERCANKKLYINVSQKPDPEELITKLYSIVEELMDMGKPQKKFSIFNLFRKKRRPDPKQLFPFIMNINMYFSDDIDADFYDDGFDGEDWWSN